MARRRKQGDTAAAATTGDELAGAAGVATAETNNSDEAPEAPAASGPSKEEISVAQRAAFDAAMKAGNDEDYWAKRQADGEAKADKDEDGDEKAEEPESEGDGEEEEQPERETGKKSIEYRRARAALERDGWKKSELDELGDDALIERGRPRATFYSRYDRDMTRLKSGGAGKEGEGDAGVKFVTTAVAPPDLTESYAKLDALVAGDPAGFAKELQALQDKRESVLVQRIDRLEKALSAQFEVNGQRMLKQTASRIVDRFPDLANDENFRAVNEYVEHNWNRPKYEGLEPDDKLEQLLIDGSRAEGLREKRAEDVSEEDRQRADRLRASRRNGKPTAGGRKGAPASTLDRLRLGFDAAMRGGNADDVRKAAGL